jgi:hypothetical protein
MTLMAAELRTYWLVVLAAAWVAAALHASLSMRRYGRRWWVWFLISLFFTVIPAAVVSYVDYFRQRRRRADGAAPARCPHCGADLDETEARRVGGSRICGRCGMTLSDERYA